METAKPSPLSGALLSKKHWFFCGALVLAAGLMLYGPVFSADFWTDDYAFVALAARLSFPQYLSQYFDPRNLISWYRPLQGMLWWVEYQFFGVNSTGYHVVNDAIHLANCFLIFALVTRQSGKWWVGLSAALAFLSLTLVAIDVFWPGVADPQLVLFYLITLWLWLNYLASPSRLSYLGAFVGLVATILTKEMGAPLIAIMFLADRLLVGRPASWKQLALRYLPFVAVMIPYAAIEYSIQTRGVYVNFVTYGSGGHPLENLANYALWLTFPWATGSPANYLAAVVVAGALLYFILIRRRREIAFLAASGLISVLPVLPFPFAVERYLYLPLIYTCVLFALGLEFVREQLRLSLLRRVAIPGLAAVFFVWSGAGLADSALGYSGLARQTRLQFRPIFQQHPKLDSDTLLYFVDPPFPTPTIGAMMYLRYGGNVSVYGTDRDQLPHIREHTASFVYYKDEQGAWQEAVVEKTIAIHAAPQPPVEFEKSISLLNFDLANPKVTQGRPVVLILYWQSSKAIDRDYTVFVHVVDALGHIVAGMDNQPRQGAAPTSRWRANSLIADAYVLPIDVGVSPGPYRLEVGLYDATTTQRLFVLDSSGKPVSDKVVIDPIIVEGQGAQ